MKRMGLVRDKEQSLWMANFFLYCERSIEYPYCVINRHHKHCIPFNEDTKHLLGTPDEAPEYYRI